MNLSKVLLILCSVATLSVFAQDVKTAKKNAKVALNKNDYSTAMTNLKIMLQAKPDDAKAQENLAKCAVNLSTNQAEMIEFYTANKPLKTASILTAAYKYKAAGKTDVAVHLYERIAEIDDKEPTSATFLSDYYYNTAKIYDKAYKHYIRKAKYVKTDKYESYYYAGHAAMEIEKWQDGLTAFTNAKKNTDKKTQPKVFDLMEDRIMWAKREVRDEPMRQKLMAAPLNVEIENMGPNINSKWDEYYGATNADESMFLFTSRREGSYGTADSEGDWPEDFWYSTKDSLGNWTKAKNLGAPINQSGHEGLPSLSADGQSIYFYMSGPKGDGNIYQSDITGVTWSTPVKLSFCEDTYWETQATISSDGNTIYFISKRDEKDPDNSDIFYSERKRNGAWKKAKNLGSPINTVYNESSPFIHPDGKTLYFSSQGHAGVGDYDIFKSVFDGKKWGEPVNVGYPINSRGSDNGFFLNAMGTKAYLHSERDSTQGALDFYIVHLTPKPKPVTDSTVADTTPVAQVAESVKATAVTTVVGVVTDEDSGEPLEANIEMQNLTLGESIQDFRSNGATGKYVVVIPAGNNYAIAVRKKGYLIHSENFNIPDSAASSIITKNIKLKKIEVGKSIVLNNIFFATGSATLSTESTLELERIVEFMNDEKSLKIEISGHTDNVGSDESNLTLSNQRSKAVVDYLIGKGIVKERLVSKGYGESTPIANNETPEGRALNRRTEFKILSK